MTWRIDAGDARAVLAGWPAGSVQCVCTSPPYFAQREYGIAGQIGLEPTIEAYVAELVEVFRAVRRVLRSDGTLFLNLGDSYTDSGKGGNPDGSKWKGFVGNAAREQAAKPRWTGKHGLGPKQLMLIPFRVAMALQADGWVLRQVIPWVKANAKPEPTLDRPNTSLEYVFLFAVRPHYYFNMAAVQQYRAMDRHWRNGDWLADETGPLVFNIPTSAFTGGHYAVMPGALAEACILAGSRPGDTVLDPFAGAGTTVLEADRHDRNGIGIELNPVFAELARARIVADAPLFNREGAA